MTAVAPVLLLLLVAPQALGKVESSFDQEADFRALKTFTWRAGHQAMNPVAHETIVDAIDAQMAGLGVTRVESGSADVVLKYHVVRGSDIDRQLLERTQKSGRNETAPEGILGRLVVVLYPPSSTTPLWQASLREHLSNDVATRTREIQGAVAALFETYPTRRK